MSPALKPGPDFRRFILDNTAILCPPHVPEIKLHLADEAHELWKKTEEELGQIGLPPPFWAFAWAGGQGLARHVLDNPECVRGKSVLDFATGSGLVAIAAVLADAGQVLAADTDVFAGDAVSLNSRLNNVSVDYCETDLTGQLQRWDVILAGDVFYDRQMMEKIVPWFERLAAAGADILIGDPGRSYLPKDRLIKLSEHEVPVTRALEDTEVKRTTVWRFKN
jgi:predicted nicotinamide N-methyase